ncbi:MAG: hypothetical protein ACI3XR_06830 [Eubacteriales bacterium]
MIGICPKCGNYEWDKTVSGHTVTCPKCTHTWSFRKLPLFILSGCSGMGKTTTAQELMQRSPGFVVLDGDLYNGILPLTTDEDRQNYVDQMLCVSKDIMQSGMPVLWSMAGCLDKMKCSYHARFFSEIYCLALVCGEDELRRKMVEGRKIRDENWIMDSIGYNRYFKTHSRIGDLSFDTLDMTGKSVSEVADGVCRWVNAHMHIPDRE